MRPHRSERRNRQPKCRGLAVQFDFMANHLLGAALNSLERGRSMPAALHPHKGGGPRSHLVDDRDSLRLVKGIGPETDPNLLRLRRNGPIR